MSNELKPCPFCGKAEAKIITDELFERNTGYYHVVCDASTGNNNNGCGVSCGFYETKEKAAQAWNTRETRNDT